MELDKKKVILFSVTGFLLLAFSLLLVQLITFEADYSKAEEVENAVDAGEEYGFDIDSFYMVKGKVQRNENLSTILQKHKISLGMIDKMSKTSRELFDTRKIAAGNEYTVFCTKDSNQIAQCFVYEINASDYIVFDFRDTLNIYRGEKPVETKMMTVSGKIYSSLYATMEANNINLGLAMELSTIYAWTVDFYKIQKGDYFKVIYEEKFVDGHSIGVGRIHAALFNNDGKDFYSFWSDIKGATGYYDENGESLKKLFLKAPLKFSRISSSFSAKRLHPVLKVNRPHLGTDYAAPAGTPIMATADGKVIAAAYTAGNGNYVKIKHNATYTTQYLHMSKIAKGIKDGSRVKQGDVIGYVGSTGLATGPHVCYRFWKNGKQVDPKKDVVSQPADPINKAHLGEYKNRVKELRGKLDSEKVSARES